MADLTSGFRVVRAAKFREFLHLLPNGFSYPTTITMMQQLRSNLRLVEKVGPRKKEPSAPGKSR